MKDPQACYYQFQKELNYQVFIRFEDGELEKDLSETLALLGFSKIDSKDLKNISFNKFETKVLKVQKASPRVAKQIQGFSNGMEGYGPESLSSHGSYEVYLYQNAGMIVLAEDTHTWEMGVTKVSSNMEKIRVMMVRFISWALASKGVVAFWAVPVEQGFVVMKPSESQYEAVFVDIDQMALMTQDGLKPISADLQILRLDETLKNATKRMSKEGLLSFLCANTAYLSYKGLPGGLRKSLFEVASFATGIVYPVENFKPRSDLRLE